MLDRETPVKSQTLFNVLPGLASVRKMNARVLGLYFIGMLTRLREKSEFHNIVPTGVSSRLSSGWVQAMYVVDRDMRRDQEELDRWDKMGRMVLNPCF
jgi:hypothetical protein